MTRFPGHTSSLGDVSWASSRVLQTYVTFHKLLDSVSDSLLDLITRRAIICTTAVQHMSAILLLFKLVVELLYATKFNYHYCCKDELLQLSHKCTHYTYAFMPSYLTMFTDSEA